MINSTRCCVCNKKIRKGLSDVLRCKCLSNVCLQHRYPDQHNCSYDFRKENKSRLRRELPRVECEKILKI